MVQRKNGEPKDDAALELTTIVAPADVVTIDGTRYDLLNFAGLGLRERAELNALAQRIQKLEGKANPTPADITEHRQKLIRFGHCVLPDAPAAVLDKLDDSQLEDLGVTFFVRAAVRSPRMEMLRRSRIGGTSFRDLRMGTASAPESS